MEDAKKSPPQQMVSSEKDEQGNEKEPEMEEQRPASTTAPNSGGEWGGWGFSAFSVLSDLQKAATVAAEEISRNALGSALKGGSNLVQKLEHSAVNIADSIQHGGLPAGSVPPLLIETGKAFTTKGMQVLEYVGKETMDLLINETGFFTATMPGPTIDVSVLIQKALNDQDSQMDNRYTYDDGAGSHPIAFTFGPMFLCSKTYQLSPPEDCALASMLMRPIRLYMEEDKSRELVLYQEKYGSVNRVFIISERDMVSKEDFVHWMIHENPPHQVEVIKGSDHMVMMSKTTHLCNLLLCIAKRYNY
ncbi:hypothetical protein F3Y22_tig00110339pilonHSYRG00104 [Hibiscus syriacus]|uniref:Uncharacterized protein n=1 Tax=Hibiscus syriacus TaxID=106335 RepID=A0A6A3AUR2_HIBSY|nr:hypothetical protein F3Y22_tig00110339pilonHSYRG00104 [Hibiscus syriacus]